MTIHTSTSKDFTMPVSALVRDECKHGYSATPVYGYYETVIGYDVEDESHGDVFGSFFCAE